MKIANITIRDYDNYGNRLQLYSMQKILLKYGEVVDFGRFQINKSANNLNFHYRLKLLIKLILFIDKRYKRLVNFEKFNNKISEKNLNLNKKTITKINKNIDFFVTGSDQIWNPNFNDMYISMLGFAEEGKRVAIATSVAVDELTKEQEEEFKKYLRGFKYLSCREQQGADLISKIVGKPVEALIDPTLMLDAEEWLKISKKPKFHDENKKYILVYFLGELTPSYKYVLDTISKKYNLEIINLMDKKSRYYVSGPSEFVYLIANSELVITDSFHGSIFAYIFDKPLRIFKRKDKVKSMNSRLVNLINKLNLDDNIYFEFGKGIDNFLDINYDKTYLKQEQEKFVCYVEKVLGVKS